MQKDCVFWKGRRGSDQWGGKWTLQPILQQLPRVHFLRMGRYFPADGQISAVPETTTCLVHVSGLDPQSPHQPSTCPSCRSRPTRHANESLPFHHGTSDGQWGEVSRPDVAPNTWSFQGTVPFPNSFPSAGGAGLWFGGDRTGQEVSASKRHPVVGSLSLGRKPTCAPRVPVSGPIGCNVGAGPISLRFNLPMVGRARLSFIYT
ncbi:hypothetical protein CRG98_038312 [Punica granatum]|uniref:Uncharacterized protein n=1 Tax=Punica granatum TaxID=22663 RepID=A0A2I0IBB7_PUNGR|nr:hypothetical protein CRG98_038312 [Punica granatum]